MNGNPNKTKKCWRRRSLQALFLLVLLSSVFCLGRLPISRKVQRISRQRDDALQERDKALQRVNRMKNSLSQLQDRSDKFEKQLWVLQQKPLTDFSLSPFFKSLFVHKTRRQSEPNLDGSDWQSIEAGMKASEFDHHRLFYNTR